MKKWIVAFALILGGGLAYAQLFPSDSGYSGYLSNESALAYDKTFAIDLAPYKPGTISAQVTYGSATIANVTFVDGAQSTGTITVVDYTKLSSAAATAQFTVVSTKTLGGAILRVGPNLLTSGQEWTKATTKQLTAASIATAISNISGFSASANNGVVYATAPYGDAYNYWLFSSNNSSITASAASLTGGRDRAVITINGTALTSGSDWFASVSSVTTAASIVTAINANATLNTTLIGTSGTTLASDYGVVNIKSIYDCATCGYTVTSSTQTKLQVSFPTLYNGTNSQVTLGSSIFKQSAPHNLTLALPVLYTAGSVALGGLTDQTTYYAIPTTGLNFQLSKQSTGAVAGANLVVITSTNTQIYSSMHTYTLHPLPLSGNSSFKWQVSNNNSSWTDLSVTSVTVTSSGYTAGNTTAGWDLGALSFRYLRLNADAPATGGIVLQTELNINK